jgi:hypothetical protein
LSHDSSLEPVLRAVEPAARLVPERHLREVLNYLIDRGQRLSTNPDLPFWFSRDDLVAADVLPQHVMAGTEPRLLLITDPNDRMIERLAPGEQLRVYWQVLFEAEVMREIDRKRESGVLTPAACTQRLNQFGEAVGREIRYVLESEHLVDPEANDDGARFRAFAATYLVTATFAPYRIAALFPSLPTGAIVESALAADIDFAGLLARSRPAGALDPEREPDPIASWTATDTRIASPPTRLPAQSAALLGQALEAEKKGNNVRAAILRTTVAAAGGEDRMLAVSGAVTALGKLVDALGDLFAWDHETRREWRQALVPLLEPASAGIWPHAARCLYELQTIPADIAREVFAIDLPEAIRTFGRRPVTRPLPRAKAVRLLMHLKKAHSQLLRAGLGPANHLRLDGLFHHQLKKTERAIRDEFTPIIADALSRAGLVPGNMVEDVARDKLIAELLDRVCDRGYLRIGDLRDAIARNRLKMPDLAGPREFLRGDALLRADSNLAYALDGVYRRGEFYLRWIQRFSALFFGTPIGRLFTLFIALPFGGAYLTLMAEEEMRHIAGGLISAIVNPATAKAASKPPAEQPPPPPPANTDLIEADEVDVVEIDDEGNVEIVINEVKPGTITSEETDVNDQGELVLKDPVDRAEAVREVISKSVVAIPTEVEPHHRSAVTSWPVVLSFGCFLLLAIHVPPFRRLVLLILATFWWVIRGILWDIPMGIWRSAAVRAIRQSLAVRLIRRYLWSPLLVSAAFYAIVSLPLFVPIPIPPGYMRPVLVVHSFLLQWGWAVWAVLTLAYNTPWGWVIQDRVAEAISDWWRVVRVNLLPGLLSTIIDWFRMLANWIERQLYAVDEWLRYRGGDSHGSFAVKALLGLLWFPIAYVFRFAFYLLLEPQINPLKHFPVVTVSHKMLLPLVVTKDHNNELSMFGELIANQTGWGIAKSNYWGFMIIAGIPGIFGFMAWEFVANWQMYRANRSMRLRPVMLGSHGETMRGMLRPGFHSGTVPKIFRKIRHARRERISRFRHDLDHAAEGIHRFIERELVHVLARWPEWGGLQLQVEAVRFGCQRVVIELAAPDLGRDLFAFGFENVGGRIEATIEQLGWADKLTEPQRTAFTTALRGILDMAAAERVDGRGRTDESTIVPGFDCLTGQVCWEEWVERWTAKSS